MPASDLAIATYNLGKKYPGSKKFALRGLDLDIPKGEVYGFLGPNGAGKTTTIRLLMNFIQPTTGEAKILGHDSVLDSVGIKANVGYLAGEIELYPKMTGYQFLEYMAALQRPKRASFVNNLSRRFEVTLGQRIGRLSKGNRQKIGIIQAFMHEPDVLILDEPTAGLDPLMQEVFYELVRETKNKGVTFFISSHNLSEVQKMCDRVGFVRDGKLISEQTIGDFAKQAVQTYDIAFEDKAPLAQLRRIAGAKVTVNTPHHITVRLKGELKPLFKLLSAHSVHSLDRRELHLE